MTTNQHVSEIATLPVEEQLAIVQAVWERLPECASSADTAKIKAELDRRMDRYHDDPSTALTIDQFVADRDTMHVGRRIG
jgi:putative addiction module component (TIGR02574 family)